MATYQELFDLYNNSELLDKVTVAVAVAAETVMNESDTVTNHTNRFIWARTAMENPRGEANKFMMVVLAANKSAAKTDIQSATDTQIQNNVNDAIDLMAGV